MNGTSSMMSLGWVTHFLFRCARALDPGNFEADALFLGDPPQRMGANAAQLVNALKAKTKLKAWRNQKANRR